MSLYLEVDSAELPPDSIAPDTPRFERLTRRAWPVRKRVLSVAAGALVSLAGAWLMIGGDSWAQHLVVGGMVAIWLGADGGNRLHEYQEKPDGAYILVPAEVEARITTQREQKIQASVGRARAGALVVGVLGALGWLLSLLMVPDSPSEWVKLLGTGVFVAGMLRFAIKGDLRFLPLFGGDADEPEAASPRFHELADPTRPLPPLADPAYPLSDELPVLPVAGPVLPLNRDAAPARPSLEVS